MSTAFTGFKENKDFPNVYEQGRKISNLIYGIETDRSYVAKTVTFQVTEFCNLDCTYCYQINKSNKKLSLEYAKKFIDLLIEEYYTENSYFYQTDCVILEFIGGEPLIEVDLIYDIIEYFKKVTIKKRHPWAKNYMISMISNGVLYFNEKVQKLLKDNEGKLDFSISLDGCKELHDKCRVFHNGKGSYDIAEKACKHYMANYNPNMSTKLTLAPENIDWLSKAMINLIENLNYTIIHSNCIFEEGWNEEHALIFYEELKKVGDYILDNDLENDTYISLFDDKDFQFKKLDESDNGNFCGTTGSMVAIAPSGDIFTCIRFMRSSLGDNVKPFSIGNIETGIGRRPEYKNRINLLDSITRRSQSDDECWNCPIGSGCGWCTANNYQETGTPNKRVKHICIMHKARALGNVYFLNKLYRKHNMTNRKEMHIPKEWALSIISEEEYNMLYDLQK